MSCTCKQQSELFFRRKIPIEIFLLGNHHHNLRLIIVNVIIVAINIKRVNTLNQWIFLLSKNFRF